MKLIDLLVQELPKRGGWPAGAAFVAQEEGGELWSFTSKPQKDCDGEWMDQSSRCYHTKVGKLREASDHDISTISRDQYEAVLAAKNDGWIDWSGGECPVSDSEIVDVIFGPGGRMSTNIAGCWRWSHSGTDSDIIAYRLHQPQEVAHTEAERKRDAAVEAMQREADEGDNWIYSEYEIIYDAIAAGKIPGVKLEG